MLSALATIVTLTFLLAILLGDARRRANLAYEGGSFRGAGQRMTRCGRQGVLSRLAHAFAWPGGNVAGGPLDAELQLMDADTLAQTADSDAVDLGEGVEASPIQAVGLLVNVTARDATTGNESYAFTVYESADNQSWTSTGLTVTVTAVGQIVKIIGVTKRYVKLAWTLGGTTPSITASAWLTKP